MHALLNMEKSQEGNVSVTVNNGSTSSNVGRIRGGRELVTITPLPTGTTVRPPFCNPAPRALSSGSVVVRPAATQISAQQRLPVNVLQHSGGPRQVASKLDKVLLM